ncbi:MAG TPA: hypothetical protein VEA79_05030 [Phenylobacterium sp.]|nr:hypothetical protein [Phenylobacterium sp.]
MLKRFLLSQIDKLERRYGYDASYMRLMARVSPKSAAKFGFVASMVDAKAAPAEALAAAGLAATLAEDCGPCTQISVDIATEAGVAPATLRAILAGDEAGMGEAAALAWRFAKASLAREMERCDPLREEIVRRWGEAGLVAIGLTLTKARMYPTLKYALGYGKACSRVTVAGEPASLALAA